MTKRMPGFFDVEERLRELSAKGDDLERVKALVDFEIFRPALEAAVSRADRSKGGRPPFDHVLMFKVLILQAIRRSVTVAFPRTGRTSPRSSLRRTATRAGPSNTRSQAEGGWRAA